MITSENLSVGYGSPILQHINLTLRSGSLTCLVGVNGSGKSTLIRTLAGLQKPLGGVVCYDGVNIANFAPQRLAQLVSVVLTDPVPDSLMTVRELVAAGRMPHTGFLGVLADNDKMIVEKAISRLQIAGIANRPLHKISDGQRQRALIARAIAQETPVILLDEPTAFLDFRARAEVMQLLCDLAHTEGKAVLCSTHELDLAERHGDGFWIVDGGEVRECGSTSSLTRTEM